MRNDCALAQSLRQRRRVDEGDEPRSRALSRGTPSAVRYCMLERLANLPAGIDGLKARGKLSRTDYDSAFLPLLDGARRDGHRIKLLYELGPEFVGLTPGGVWEDLRLGLPFLSIFTGCALVSDHALARDVTRLMGLRMPFPLRIFRCAERESAVAWLASLREPDSRISHRLLPALV